MRIDQVGKINSIDRLNNSRNGNPRFRIGFTDGTSYDTAADASCGYGIGNKGQSVGDTVAVELTNHKHRKIARIEPAPVGEDVLAICRDAHEIDPRYGNEHGAHRYERNASVVDRTLAAAIDVLTNEGVADETEGSITEGIGFAARVGRHVNVTDTQGFVVVESYDSQPEAEARVAMFDYDDGSIEPHVDNEGHEVHQ